MNIIEFPNNDIKQVPVEELKSWWDNWDGEPCTDFRNFTFEEVFFEMNRRGYGKYVAV